MVMASVAPYLAAVCSGVLPERLRRVRFAPNCSSTRNTPTCTHDSSTATPCGDPPDSRAHARSPAYCASLDSCYVPTQASSSTHVSDDAGRAACNQHCVVCEHTNAPQHWALQRMSHELPAAFWSPGSSYCRVLSFHDNLSPALPWTGVDKGKRSLQANLTLGAGQTRTMPHHLKRSSHLVLGSGEVRHGGALGVERVHLAALRA
jgi:hypothetical protein